MKWISKDPPIYVWPRDTWYNERDGFEYYADIDKAIWEHPLRPEAIPFTKKTRILSEPYIQRKQRRK